MDTNAIQKKCEEFLEQLGVPGFIIFGWEQQKDKINFVSSYREMPVKAAMKGLCWALDELATKLP